MRKMAEVGGWESARRTKANRRQETNHEVRSAQTSPAIGPIEGLRPALLHSGAKCYSQAGAYFVTIVTHDRECAFGEIVECEMRLNEIGHAASECWAAMPTHHSNIELDEFVVMPNRVHGIISIADNGRNDNGDAGTCKGVQLNAPTSAVAKRTRDADNRMSAMSPYRETLSVVIRTFKAAVTTAARVGGQIALNVHAGGQIKQPLQRAESINGISSESKRTSARTLHAFCAGQS